MSDQFEISSGGTVVGPASLDQIRRGVEAGKIPGDAQIRAVGTELWTPVRELLARQIPDAASLPTPPTAPEAPKDNRASKLPQPLLLVVGGALVVLSVAAIVMVIVWPTRARVDRLIDERLAERGLAPLPLPPGSASAAPSASAAASASPNARPEGEPVVASGAFLTQLDDLMKDYKPELPVVEDKSDVLRCITSDAAKNDPDAKKAVAALKSQMDAARKERVRQEREFYDTAYPLAFHYDLDWAVRKSKAIPAQYNCFNVTYGRWTSPPPRIDQESCLNSPMAGVADFEWRARVPGRPEVFLYSNSETAPTQPPELMHRMDAAGVKALTRFSCRVDDVVAAADHKTVTCRSSGPSVALRVSGSLPAVNVGDVVSVPLANTKRDPDGVLLKNVGTKTGAGSWLVDADGASLTVDSAATCPSVAEIQTAIGGDGGK